MKRAICVRKGYRKKSSSGKGKNIIFLFSIKIYPSVKVSNYIKKRYTFDFSARPPFFPPSYYSPDSSMSSTEGQNVIHWVGFGVSVAATALTLWLGWASKTFTKRLKMLANLYAIAVTGIIYGVMAFGTGHKIRSDARNVNWLRYVMYAITHGAVLANTFLSLDENHLKSVAGVLGGTLIAGVLAGAAVCTGDAVWYLFIWSSIILVFMGAYAWFWVLTPSDSAISGTSSIAIKIATIVVLSLFQLMFILDSTWTNAISNQDVVVGLYLVLDIAKFVLLVSIFKFFDLVPENQGMPSIPGAKTAPPSGTKDCRDSIGYSQMATPPPRTQPSASPYGGLLI